MGGWPKKKALNKFTERAMRSWQNYGLEQGLERGGRQSLARTWQEPAKKMEGLLKSWAKLDESLMGNQSKRWRRAL